MSHKKYWYDYLLLSNIYVGLIAILNVWLIATTFNISIPSYYYTFIFCSTLACYSFHRFIKYFSKESILTLPFPKYTKFILLLWAIIAFVLALVQICKFPKYAALYFAMACCCILYSLPYANTNLYKYFYRFSFFKPLILSLLWTFIIYVLTYFIFNNNLNYAVVLFIFNRWCFIFIVCLVFNYQVPYTKLQKWALISTAVIFITSCLGVFFLFSSGLAFSLLFPFLLLLTFVRYLIKPTNKYWYYFFLDGLVGLSAIIYYWLQ
jgi:hypothetical protein